MKLKPLILSCVLWVAANSSAAAELSAAAAPVDWKAQVSKAILDGRCEDAKTIALQANDLDVAEQALRLCKPSSTGAKKPTPDMTEADMLSSEKATGGVQRVEQSKNVLATSAPAPERTAEQKATNPASSAASNITSTSSASGSVSPAPQGPSSPAPQRNPEPANPAVFDGKTEWGYDWPTANLNFLSSAAEVDVTVTIWGSTFWAGKVDPKKAPLVRNCRTPCLIKIPINHQFKVRFDAPSGWIYQSATDLPRWKEKFFGGPILEPSFIRANLIRSPTNK